MLWVYFVIVAIIIAIDQLTKLWIVRDFELHESVSVIGEFFQITSHRNRGAAFGILQDQRWFFIIITIIIVIGIIWYMLKMVREGATLLPIALTFVLGGALGNFIDRVRTGEVVDFMHFTFTFDWFGRQIKYEYAIFNVADMAVVLGVILVLLDTLIAWRKERKELKPR